MRSAAVVLGLLLSSTAWAGGGFGFTLDSAGAPKMKPWSNEFDAPGSMICFGNVAWGRLGSSRIGGETNMCLGRPGVTQGNVGLQAGSFYDLGDHGLYLSPYLALGLGGQTDTTPSTGTYRSFFVYAKPVLAFGRTFKHVALETGLYAQVPINLIQWVADGHGHGLVTPTFGLQAEILFGRFRPRVVESDLDESYEAPLAIPGPESRPPMNPPVGQDPRDERPLAIPADEPPPPR